MMDITFEEANLKTTDQDACSPSEMLRTRMEIFTERLQIRGQDPRVPFSPLLQQAHKEHQEMTCPLVLSDLEMS